MSSLIKKIIEQEIKEKNLIYPFVAGLTKRERAILSFRERGKSLQFIGNRLGVTRERVRQLEERALNKLEYQEEIIENLVQRLSEFLFTEAEIEEAFHRYVLRSAKVDSEFQRKLKWLGFSRMLWRKKTSKRKKRRPADKNAPSSSGYRGAGRQDKPSSVC